MATKLYDLIVATSKYKDRNGQEKRHWENIGSVFEDTDNNGNTYRYIMLKRTFNPAGIEARDGADAIRITLSKPKAQQAQQSATKTSQSQQAQGYPDFDNDNSNPYPGYPTF